MISSSPLFPDRDLKELHQTLNEFRIGVVPFLNVLPLIIGANQWKSEEPRQLATSLHQGKFDIALVPIFECLNNPIYRCVKGVGITSCGFVKSVIVTGCHHLQDLTHVERDLGSYTSHHLLRSLLESGITGKVITPEYVDFGTSAPSSLLIGDRALDWHQNNPNMPHIDLGHEWTKLTHLPFVYAVWAIHPQVSEAKATVAADTLRAIGHYGTMMIDQMSLNQESINYLKHNIKYHLADNDILGVKKYSELLFQIRVLQKPVELNWL